MAIAQGTTPTHTFALPFTSEPIKKMRVVYAQGDEVVLIKSGEDVVAEGNIVKTTLTQEDTLKLNPEKTVKIQLRILTTGGTALNSEIFLRSVDECLDKEVL